MRMMGHIGRQKSTKRVFHLLGSHTHLGQIAATTARASRPRSRIRAHRIRGTAGMTYKHMRALVIGKRS